MDDPRHILDISLAYIENILSRVVEGLEIGNVIPKKSGTCLGPVWDLSGTFIGNVLDLFGTCLEYFFQMSVIKNLKIKFLPHFKQSF